MTAEWKVIPMGELCSISSGDSDTQDAVADGPYVFFDRSKTIKRSNRFLYDCEALIIPGEGKEFFPRRFKGKFDLHQRAYAIFDFAAELDVRFLYHLLHYRSDYFPGVAVGATVKSLRRRHFQEFPVPLPSLLDQHRIVALLDEAFAGIATAKANAENNLRDAGEFFDKRLNQIFSGGAWPRRPISDVCAEIFAGGDVPKNNHSKEPAGKHQIPIYTNGEKNNGLYGYTDIARVTTPSLTISARGTIGYTEIRSEGYYPAIRLIVVVPDASVLDLRYAYYAVRTIDISHSGASIPQLTVPMVREFTIPLPPVAKQKELAVQLDTLRNEVSRLQSIYTRKLAALDELKQSLLHQAFSGQL